MRYALDLMVEPPAFPLKPPHGLIARPPPQVPEALVCLIVDLLRQGNLPPKAFRACSVPTSVDTPAVADHVACEDRGKLSLNGCLIRHAVPPAWTGSA
jgi:hypothetical protein